MLDAARRELDRVTAEHGLELEEAVDDDGNLIGLPTCSQELAMLSRSIASSSPARRR